MTQSDKIRYKLDEIFFGRGIFLILYYRGEILVQEKQFRYFLFDYCRLINSTKNAG